MPVHVKVAGAWREVRDSPFVKVAGTHRVVNFAYVKVSGTWRTTYIRDNTGPAPITSPRATWNNGPCDVTWTNPPDADLAGVRIDRIRGGVNDGPIAYVTAFGPGAAATYVDADIRENNTIYTYFLYPYDALGNYGAGVAFASMQWTNYSRGRFASPFVLDPNATGTWRNGAFRTDLGNRPLQGYTAAGMNVGCYFYAGLDQITGATISGMTMQMYRVAAGGAGGAITPSMWLTQTRAPDGVTDPSATLAFNAAAPGVCRNGTCDPFTTFTCPSSWYEPLCNKNFVPGYYGIAMYDPDTTIQAFGTSLNYGLFYGATEVPGSVTPGRITIVHSG